MPKALVVGALGVVGRANVEYLTTLPDWSVVALSRRAPDFDTRARFISCDVTDRNALRSALAGHPDIVGISRSSTSRHSAATQQLRRFQSEADMNRIYEYAP